MGALHFEDLHGNAAYEVTPFHSLLFILKA
jgi:hypothetical protein